MAKTSKKKGNEPISTNTIYEIIKDQNLVQELWKEIISDIEDKPTYKYIKEMVECVINNTLHDFDTIPPDNSSEHLRRRAEFTEISIMAFTFDKIISEFLYKRLHNEFKSLLDNMLKEFQSKKGAKTVASPSNINSMFENIESIFTKTEQEDEDPVNIPQVEAEQKPVRKRGRPRKAVTPSATSSSESSSGKKVKRCLSFEERGNFIVKDSDQDSNLTFNSLSSVNTTDLSSFDDNVSICTDDGKNGRKKKKVPLNKANSMVVEGRLSHIYKVDTTVEINRRKRESAPRKVLPQRRRQPNSKYNPETMYCQVKDYTSSRLSPSSEQSSEALEDKASSNSAVKREAKRTKISNGVKEHSSPIKQVTKRSLRNVSPTKGGQLQNIPVPSSSSTPSKNSTQKYTSSDLYKPRFHFGSSSNNRSATSFTVFS